jgi:uncharacterized protein (DUF4415 family)
MRKRSDTARHTGRKIRSGRRTRTDWKKVDAMTEAALEASIAADPDDVHAEPDWARAVKGLPPPKEPIKLRIDADVLAWFRRTGKGYQTRMNNVLRAFVDSRKTGTR